MSKSWMRGLGAGLMEAGRQAELSRREKLEQQKEANLLAIAEGRQDLMREQMKQSADQFDITSKEQSRSNKALEKFRQTEAEGRNADRKSMAEHRAAVLTDGRMATFHQMATQAVTNLYGEKGMSDDDRALLKSMVTGGYDLETAMKDLTERGMISQGYVPAEKEINMLKEGLEAAWKSTVGQGKNPLPFDVDAVMAMHPVTYQGSAEDRLAAAEKARQAALAAAEQAAAAAEAGEEDEDYSWFDPRGWIGSAAPKGGEIPPRTPVAPRPLHNRPAPDPTKGLMGMAPAIKDWYNVGNVEGRGPDGSPLMTPDPAAPPDAPSPATAPAPPIPGFIPDRTYIPRR